MADLIEQLDAMRMGIDYTFPITCRKLTIPVRPLSIAETIMVANQVNSDMMTKTDAERHGLTEQVLFARYTLEKASSPEDLYAPKISGYIFDKMTPAEIMHLFKQYSEVCDKTNPSLEDLPLDEVMKCAEQVKKSPSAAIELSFLQLVNLVRYLVTKDG